jgi:pimeloyl-ACP methyl ester carboxylesterase
MIEGTLRQSGMEFPMNLSREVIEKPVVKRSQEPSKPYPYYSEEVTFQNGNANITLAGTLTLPQREGNFPAVILISGSGPQNRDEELLGHKPFLVISDYLTRNGIAVLRYDDRGVAQSKGDFKTATTVDFASDVESAIAFLKTRKEINKSKIGLIGHSEGGIIAPMVAAKLKEVNFIVLLAGTGIRGDKLLLLQQEAIAKASGTSDEAIQRNREINTKAFEMVFKSASTEALKRDLEKYLKETSVNNPSVNKGGMTDDQFIALQIAQVTSPWMQYFIKYDPAPTLEKVKCPVLAVNGEKDLQVPPKVNLPAIEKALKAGGNKQVTIKEFPGLNHLFQECKTGAPAEYAEIDQTFSPLVLEVIGKWIIEKTK